MAALVAAGARFVVVGVGGINFYARDASEVAHTLDLDLVVAPAVENLRCALRVLSSCGFEFTAGDEPFVDVEDEPTLRSIVRAGALVSARHASGAALDLMLSMTGFSFDALNAEAVTFRLAGTTIAVGKLEHLLRSKELADRPKDQEFLRLYRARLSGS